MFGARWFVGGGALLVACVALYVLLRVGGPSNHDRADDHAASTRELREPALDDIDAKSRKAMRDLLRQADRDE